MHGSTLRRNALFLTISGFTTCELSVKVTSSPKMARPRTTGETNETTHSARSDGRSWYLTDLDPERTALVKRQGPHVRNRAISLISAAGLLLAGGLAASSPANAAAPNDTGPDTAGKKLSDNMRSPQAVKQDALLQKALVKKLKGDQSAQGKVARLGSGQYVNLENEGTDRVFVILAEFGDTRHSAYPDTKVDGSAASDAQRFDGPMHNQIPQPDRAVDNSTLWQSDFNTGHYQDMYFNRMAKYYETQSSGRYSVNGDVTEWVRVPFNEARYGRDTCGGIVCNNTWFLIRDGLAFWTQQQLTSGKSMEDIRAYLATFDKQDRYDIDGDGNFNEPDGFIDHFQIVHAGGDQAAGDPTYGTDAIWSHRWYAAVSGGGPGGFPGVNIGQGGTSSGVTIPDNPTDTWVGDYTIQPENGGLGVFAHEFGHDLGLPDLYDTSGNTGGAENSTAFWTLMSSGANIGNGGPAGIGDSPTDLMAWELFQLGWLSAQGTQGPFYDVARAGVRSSHALGANVPATKKSAALFVLLPDKKRVDDIGDPASGTQFFYSGSGDDLNNSMTRTSGITGGSLTAKVRYDIELDYDYAFIEASINGGTSWLPVTTNLSTSAATDQSGYNTSGTGLTDVSAGYDSGAYVDLTATLPAGTNSLRVRYQTDGGLSRPGLSIDDMAIGTTAIGTAETDEGWVFTGFRRTTGAEESLHFNAYVAENRQYDGYDASLKTAYNFGFLDSKPDWVETHPYENGMLVTYWDESFGDNNVGEHPGGGLILPVDAHPTFAHSSDGWLLRPRVLSYDSTFGLEATDAITVHKNSVATTISSQAAVPMFDDTNTWWFNNDGDGATGDHLGRYQPGWYGVDVPKTGTTIRVVSSSKQGNQLNVVVAPK